MKSGSYTVNTVSGDIAGPQTQSLWQDEEKVRTHRGSRRLVLTTVCLGIICVLLLIFIILQHIFITAERESLFKSHKNTVEEFNQTINRLQDNYTDLMTEKHRLKNNFNSLSQKNLEPKTSVEDLQAEKSQNSFNSLTQKKLELENRVKDLTAEKNQSQNSLNSLSQEKRELETRVKDLQDEKSQNSFNSLTQEKLELETRVKDLTAEKNQSQNSLNSLSQEKLELETRVKDLTAEKSQFQRSVDALNRTKLELESKVTSLSEELEKEKSKRGNLPGPVCLFKSNESKSWSESRQYCRDRGADLVIINTEEKQRLVSSFIKERVWIGLTDIANKRNMTWVDNSPLNQGFWYDDERNNAGDEGCVELIPLETIYNWNDLPCSKKRKGICEK